MSKILAISIHTCLGKYLHRRQLHGTCLCGWRGKVSESSTNDQYLDHVIEILQAHKDNK